MVEYRDVTPKVKYRPVTVAPIHSIMSQPTPEIVESFAAPGASTSVSRKRNFF
jgi:hypothetical protein